MVEGTSLVEGRLGVVVARVEVGLCASKHYGSWVMRIKRSRFMVDRLEFMVNG